LEFVEEAGVATASAKVAASWVSVVMNEFGVELDYSDESIRDLERVAETLFRTMPPAEQRDDDFQLACRQFTDQTGAYLGEVMRRSHGARWGYAAEANAKTLGMLTARGTIVLPIIRAQKRLTNGKEDDIWSYFKTLSE
jgi:hypothetical protein